MSAKAMMDLDMMMGPVYTSVERRAVRVGARVLLHDREIERGCAPHGVRAFRTCNRALHRCKGRRENAVKVVVMHWKQFWTLTSGRVARISCVGVRLSDESVHKRARG